MGPLIPIAMELAQFAPGVIKLMTGSDKAADVAEKVVGVAQAVTGAPTPEGAVAALRADPNKMLEFQQAMASQRVELEKFYLQTELADREGARGHDAEVRKLNGGQNVRADLAVLAVVLGLIACLWVMAMYKDKMPGEVVGILSTIAGIFGSCLKDYFSFEFGSSRNSREKDVVISNLSK